MVETVKLNAESKETRRTAEGKPEKFQHTARYLITLQLEAATINSLGIFLCISVTSAFWPSSWLAVFTQIRRRVQLGLHRPLSESAYHPDLHRSDLLSFHPTHPSRRRLRRHRSNHHSSPNNHPICIHLPTPPSRLLRVYFLLSVIAQSLRVVVTKTLPWNGASFPYH